MGLDFQLSDEHRQVMDSVRRLCAKEMAPLVDKAEEEERFPKHLFKLWGSQGLLGARYPEADGGSGMDKVADCLIREEFSATCQGFATTWSAHTHLGIWPIWRAGTPGQKERFLRPALKGEKISGFALSEPDGGSNIRAMSTHAKKVPGGWALNGSKLYISNAPIADFLLVAARTRPELKAESISLFIVEIPSKGFEISHLKKESIKSSETGAIAIDNVFVPDDCLVGEVEGTYSTLLECLQEARIGVSANAVGMARSAFEASTRYAQERIVGGKKIGDYQAVAHRLADMDAQIEAARWLVYYGAWCVDNKCLTNEIAAKVKLTATETAVRVSEMAIRIFGGAGIMREFPVSRIHRDSLVYVIGEGTSDIQRNLIARGLGFRP